MAYRRLPQCLCSYGRELQQTVSLLQYQAAAERSSIHSWASPATGAAISSWLQNGILQQVEQPLPMQQFARTFASGPDPPGPVSLLAASMDYICL